MRILFATDGSRAATRARDLLAGRAWPADTAFLVVSAIPIHAGPLGAPWLTVTDGVPDVAGAEERRHAEVTLDDAERALAGTGRPVERLVLQGHAAGSIVDEARSWGADLVVVGSRGHGPITSMVLGSTSAAIIDAAPCPVLVVRGDVPARIILAEDGSPGAAHAAAAVRTWPWLRRLPVDVVSVAHAPVPFSSGVAPGFHAEAMAAFARDRQAVLAGARDLSTQTAASLERPDRAATAHVLEGDPASEIVEFSQMREPAMVVLGTRGHHGLARMVLGSVARNVVMHAPGSVLVVRGRVRASRASGDRATPASAG